MIIKFNNYIRESRLLTYIEKTEGKLITEGSEFNQYQLNLDQGMSSFGPGYGFATDPGLSIYSPDSNPYVDTYARQAGTTSHLMQVIKQVTNDMAKDHVFARKSDRFLEDIDDYKNIKILRIFENENLKLNVYISFDFKDQEFFGVYRNFNSNYSKPTFDTEMLGNPAFAYIDKEYYLKLNQYLYKLIYNFFIPEKGMYKNLKQNCVIKDEAGQIKYLEEGKIVEVLGYNTDENNDPYIILKIQDKKFNITGNNYFYFKYRFDIVSKKIHESINESMTEYDAKAKKSFVDLITVFPQEIWSFGGLAIKLAILSKSEKDTEKLKKIKEILDFLNKIKPSFTDKNNDEEFIYFAKHYKGIYANSDKYVKLIYQTLSYLIPNIKYLNVTGLEKITVLYKNYVNDAKLSPNWKNNLPDHYKS